MSTNLDKSLDDIIGENPRRGGGRRGGNRQNNNRDSPNRNSPYSRRDGGGVQKRGGNTGSGGINKQQQAIMFNPAAFMAAAQQQQQQQQQSGRIHISNLDFGVSEGDLRQLFGQIGQISFATLNYGPNGKSKGTGEVKFKNPAHASQAVEKYHGVTLDGRPMRIEIAFNPLAAAAVAPMMMPAMMQAPMVQASGNTRSRRGGAGGSGNNAGGQANNNNGGASVVASSGGRGGRRGGRGRRNDSDNRGPMTKEALDADLDSYMQDAEKPSTTAA
ncbi:hypothetical protein GGI20_000214 [Coemansia sp. BCRC 34301]|nr:hypothetical protein GGI20_000214 [Coemansia sp. BCRC 34301]